MTPRNDAAWGPTCSIDVTLSSAYAVVKTRCEGNRCKLLSTIAPRLAEIVTRDKGQAPGAGLVALWNASMATADHRQWDRMRRTALATLHKAPFPTFGRTDDESHEYFDDQNGTVASSFGGIATPGENTAFVPIVSGGELLLGKIGADGFGCCRVSSTELLSVYQFRGDVLAPVAAFVLEPTSSLLEYSEAE